MSDSLAIVEILRLRDELEEVRKQLAANQLALSPSTMADEPARIIAVSIDAIHAAYWTACERDGKAVDPAEIGVPEGLLDDVFKNAQLVEDVVKQRDMSWAEALQATKTESSRS